MRRLAIACLALLAACATPQEACIASATRELRVLDRLLAEVRGNLDRGYALVDRTAWRRTWQLCAPPVAQTDDSPARPAQWCWVREPYTVTDRVPIDPAAERRKLDGLIERRAAEARRAGAAVAECRALHPEQASAPVPPPDPAASARHRP